MTGLGEAFGMRKGAIATVAALAIFAAAGLSRVFEPSAPAVAADAPPAAGPGIPVTAGTVASADVPVFLQAIGSVQAFNMVTIKSRVDGQLVRVDFTEGQEVKAGEPLVQIDPRAYQAQLEQAQAAKAKDEAALASAERDLARSAQLLKSNYETRQLYDQQTATVAQDQAALKGDQAQIDTAQLNLTYCDIRSPIDGRLGARLVDVGNMIHSADTVGLVTVAQLQPIFVSFTVAQENAHKIRERQANSPLEAIAYGDDGKTLLATGKLTLIDNAIDPATGTIHMKASFANQDERLWPGEFVNVRLVLSTRRAASTVPAQTVQNGSTGQYVYVIKQDNTVERRDVEIAAVQDGIAVVSKGLAPGEKVVVDGQYRLTNGARVKAEPGAAG
jgi:membrane fusion protein, multidrug efflux system